MKVNSENEKIHEMHQPLLLPTSSWSEKEVSDLIKKGESFLLEFKSTLRVDVKTRKVEKYIEHGVLKTLAAFLNSAGGTLLIGVEDNRNILGLELDFNSFPKIDKLDELRKHFDNLIHKSIGNRYQRYLDMFFIDVEGKTICVISVREKSSEPVYLQDDKNEEKFYIRRQASTIDLRTSEAHKYINDHWPQQSKISGSINITKSSTIFNSKEMFQKEFNHILSNKHSSYYEELKDHWNSYSLLDDSPFLNIIIRKNLSKSIHFGLLPLISDYTRKHLYYDKEAKYIYNQPHVFAHTSGEEGYDLPIYYHIEFIGILYTTAIKDKVDIDTVSHSYKNMITIYSAMIEGMISNLSAVEGLSEEEYPTNFHWLMAEIFSITRYWLDTFNNEKYFNEDSSYRWRFH